MLAIAKDTIKIGYKMCNLSFKAQKKSNITTSSREKTAYRNYREVDRAANRILVSQQGYDRADRPKYLRRPSNSFVKRIGKVQAEAPSRP